MYFFTIHGATTLQQSNVVPNYMIVHYRSVQNSRYCFVENAKRQNFLEDPEYETLMAWYNFTEKCMDITLDLIGKF